ncbi:MAG: hypothetical protein DMG39_06515 [Acidobacteria bacterium]|nr:MAG: hypothetical protein DMG39_06515 [Acidobacteriota bacterium]
MHWWVLLSIAAAVLLSLYGLFRWASLDPGIDVVTAKQHFRDEQEWQGLHRSHIDPVPSSHKRL